MDLWNGQIDGKTMARSSSGQGCLLLRQETGVRFSYGLLRCRKAKMVREYVPDTMRRITWMGCVSNIDH
mgnify:FL=1